MPIEYVIKDKGSFVYAHGHGAVQASDIVVHEQRLLADPRVAAGYRQLLDCRWVSEDANADELLRSLADVHARAAAKLHGARYAIVAHGSQWFNLGSQYRGGQAGVTLIVFNDPGTACIWLGADPTELAGTWLRRPTSIAENPATGLAPAF